MRNLWTKIKKCLQAEMLQKMWELAGLIVDEKR